MHIVWLILKIIGAILGSLLLLLLFLLLLILVVPVRYKIHIRAEGNFETESYVSWLLHVFHVTIQYKEKRMKYCLRIFGIPLRKNKEESEKRTKSPKKKQHKKKENRSEIKRADKKKSLPKKVHNTADGESGEDYRTAHAEQKMLETAQDIQTKTETNIPLQDESGAEEKNNVRERSRKKSIAFHPIKKVKEIVLKIRQKIRRIPIVWFQFKVKLRNLKRKKNQILDFIKDEGTKSSFRKLKKRFFEILRYIAPGKLHGYIRFGTGDPCNTGQILGVASIARAYCKTRVSIYPVFEEKTFETDLTAYGRMRVIRFLWVGGMLYFDKEIKKSIADIKQIKEELNG